MSLINRVLNDLEKRGASINIGEETLRVVHPQNSHGALLLVAATVAAMLGVGGVVWLIWQSQQRPEMRAKALAVMPVQAVTPPASQAVAVPVQAIVPRIDSVSPAVIVANGKPQLVTLNGGDFKEGARVTLRTQGGQEYANRPIVSLVPDKIVLKLNFGKTASGWTIEVNNPDGQSSGQFAFKVQPPEAAVRPQGGPLLPSPSGAAPAATKPGNLASGGVNKQPTQITLLQQADTEFRRAYQLMLQGHGNEALAGYENTLKLDPGHDQARKNMVSLLLEKKRNADAENVLHAGLQYNPKQAAFAMLLARLQVERNAVPLALETLQHTLPYAVAQADYLGFMAALMQRQSRHKEAVDYYHKALKLNSQSGVWWMGLGISLRAEQLKIEARDAFKRALESNNLNSELQSFVAQQLKELQA